MAYCLSCSFCRGTIDSSLGYPTPHKIRYCPNCYRRFGIPMWDFLLKSGRGEAIKLTNSGCSLIADKKYLDSISTYVGGNYELLDSPPRGFIIYNKPGEYLNLPLYRFFGIKVYGKSIIIKRP